MTAAQPPGAPSVRLAADIGGTFTDLVLETPRARHACKVLTTLRQPELAVLQGMARLLEEAGVGAADVGLVIHGTTLATNALIERKGARTALLTTQGFRDILEMGYEKRYEQYDIQIERPPELVPRPLRFTVPERIAADGSVLIALDEAAVEAQARAMADAGVQAVAIGFLHAHAWPKHEQRARAIVARVLGSAATVCLSSEVCPELREYERFSTTVANAYVRPLMAGYLQRLREQLGAAGVRAPLLLMMSGGGVTTLELAVRFPVRLVESGPAGGAILAAHLAREGGLPDVMAFDMGGTTAKVCLISGGQPERARRFEIGRIYRNLKGSGLPVRIPVIELVEIGAGGGSIGRVDAMSRISVGPDSAGAEPGPACYGLGGRAATVTDANLVLGRIDPQRFAAGRLKLDIAAAQDALERDVGAPLRLDALWAAAGVSEIVEENMANAARVHAVERGKSIRDCTMIAFGGAAPLHAARLAAKLGISRVLVPAGAGVGSAIGFLRAPIGFEVVRSGHGRIRDASLDALNALLGAMEQEARAVVLPAAHAVGLDSAALQLERLAELRYEGQGHELRVAVASGEITRASIDRLHADFEAAYERSYGLRIPGSQVEVVTWSVTVATPPATPAAALAAQPDQPEQPEQPARDAVAAQSGQARPAATHRTEAGATREVWDPTSGQHIAFGVHWRPDLAPGATAPGPALIVEHETTTLVPPGWSASVDPAGHLRLEALSE